MEGKLFYGNLDVNQARQLGKTLTEIFVDSALKESYINQIKIRQEGNVIIYDVDLQKGNVNTSYQKRVSLEQSAQSQPLCTNESDRQALTRALGRTTLEDDYPGLPRKP